MFPTSLRKTLVFLLIVISHSASNIVLLFEKLFQGTLNTFTSERELKTNQTIILASNLLSLWAIIVALNRSLGEQLLTEAEVNLERTAASLKSTPNTADNWKAEFLLVEPSALFALIQRVLEIVSLQSLLDSPGQQFWQLPLYKTDEG